MDSQTAALDLSAVERDLRTLWDQTEEGAVPAAHQVLLTLVTTCFDQPRADAVSALVAAVTGEHPSRAIIIEAGASGEDAAPKAEVSVSCRLVRPGAKQSCCEQVRIQAHGAPLAGVAGAVLPLVLPDLPLVVWHAGDPPKGLTHSGWAQEIQGMLSAADCLLLESGRAGDVADLLEWVETLNQQDSPAVVDLTWVGLSTVRSAIARAFDPEAARSLLADIRRVEIRSGGNGAAATEGLLVAGWLAGRLQWGLAQAATRTADGTEARLSDGRTVRLRTDETAPKGGICAVAMETDSGGVTFRFQRDGREVRATWEMAGRTETSVQVVRSRTSAQILCGALEVAGRDAVYAEAVAAALGILRAG